MADNPATLPSPPARAGLMAWTNGVDERPRRARRGRCLGLAPGRRGAEQPGRPGTGGRRPTGVGRGGAGAGRGRGALDPVAGQGGEGRHHGGARPGRRRAGAGFAGRVGDGAARGGRGRGGAGRAGRAQGERGGGKR
ncbi:uncharacterized protein [Miscanthus floridulus]|uniref:uncharacterized protein n=1 Tax=Miscanthus floridulus TaxID=154761 RepID=UPI00345B34C4